MIQSVGDVREQNALWNAAFANFQHRHDLAAAVRMAQAEMWHKNNQPAKAGQCYEDVIDRYANAGPFVLSALVEAEKILREARDGPRILLLYDHAWSKTLKPQEMAEPFRRQSNWFRVGSRYAGLLDEAGRGQEAARIRAALQQN